MGRHGSDNEARVAAGAEGASMAAGWDFGTSGLCVVSACEEGVRARGSLGYHMFAHAGIFVVHWDLYGLFRSGDTWLLD